MCPSTSVQEQGGYTPLHTAAANGNTKLVQVLLAHGADPNLEADDAKRAVDPAREKGYTEIVELLAHK